MIIALVQQVRKLAGLLFTEVQNALHQISQKMLPVSTQDTALRALESRQQIVELEGMLQKEKEEFEVKRSLTQICTRREVF